MKIKFKGWIEVFGGPPDDKGTIDNWLAINLADAVRKGEESETGLEALRILNIKSEVDYDG